MSSLLEKVNSTGKAVIENLHSLQQSQTELNAATADFELKMKALDSPIIVLTESLLQYAESIKADISTKNMFHAFLKILFVSKDCTVFPDEWKNVIAAPTSQGKFVLTPEEKVNSQIRTQIRTFYGRLTSAWNTQMKRKHRDAAKEAVPATQTEMSTPLQRPSRVKKLPIPAPPIAAPTAGAVKTVTLPAHSTTAASKVKVQMIATTSTAVADGTVPLILRVSAALAARYARNSCEDGELQSQLEASLDNTLTRLSSQTPTELKGVVFPPYHANVFSAALGRVLVARLSDPRRHGVLLVKQGDQGELDYDSEGFLDTDASLHGWEIGSTTQSLRAGDSLDLSLAIAQKAARLKFASSPRAALLTTIPDTLEHALFGPSARRVTVGDTLQDDILRGCSYNGDFSNGVLHVLTGETHFSAVRLEDGKLLRGGDFVVLNSSRAVLEVDADAIDRSVSLPRAVNLDALRALREGNGAGQGYVFSNAAYAAMEPRDERNRGMSDTRRAANAAIEVISKGGTPEEADKKARGDTGYAFTERHVKERNAIAKVEGIIFDPLANKFIIHVRIFPRGSDNYFGANHRSLFAVAECGFIPIDCVKSVVDVCEINPLDLRSMEAYGKSVISSIQANGKPVPPALLSALAAPIVSPENIWRASGGHGSFFDSAAGNASFATQHEMHSDGSLRCGTSCLFTSTAPAFSRSDAPCAMVEVRLKNHAASVLVPAPHCPSCSFKQRIAMGEIPSPLGFREFVTVSGQELKRVTATLYRGELYSVGQGVFIKRSAGVGHWRLPLESTTTSLAAAETDKKRLSFSSETHPLFNSTDAQRIADAAKEHGNAKCHEVCLIVDILQNGNGDIILEVAPLARSTDLASKQQVENAQLQLFLPHDREIFYISAESALGVCGIVKGPAPGYLSGTLAYVFYVESGFDACSSKLTKLPAKSVPAERLLSLAELAAGRQCGCTGAPCFASIFSLDSLEARSKCKRTLPLLTLPPPTGELIWPRVPKATTEALGTSIDPLNAALAAPLADQSLARLDNCIDLCGGGGGLTQGLFESGAGVVRTAVEINAEAAASLENMIQVCGRRVGVDVSKARVMVGDIADILTNMGGHLDEPGTVDAEIAGPPCGTYSALNSNTDTLRADRVANVTHSVASSAISSHPLIFVVENVVRAASHPNMQALIGALLDDAFSVRTFAFRMDAGGVASARVRWILIASAPTQILPSVPTPTHTTAVRPREPSLPDFNSGFLGGNINGLPNSYGGAAPLPPATVEGALRGLPPPSKIDDFVNYIPDARLGRDALMLRGAATRVTSHTPLAVADNLKSYVNGIASFPGANLGTLSKRLAGTVPQQLLHGGVNHVARLIAHGIAPTIVANSASMGARVAPPLAIDRNGPLSPLELGRIQTNDDETLPRGKTAASVVKQIGMSVPPAFSRGLFSSIFRARWRREANK